MKVRDLRQREPERLVHDRELGKLIAGANAAYRTGLDETGAFQRLSERQAASERGSRWHGPALGAALSVAAGLVLVLGVFDDPPSQVAMGPEMSAVRRSARIGAEPSPSERAGAAGLEASEPRAGREASEASEGATAREAALATAERLSAKRTERDPADRDPADRDPAALEGDPTDRDGDEAARDDVESAEQRTATRIPRKPSRERSAASAAAARAAPRAGRGATARQIVEAPALASPSGTEPANDVAPVEITPDEVAPAESPQPEGSLGTTGAAGDTAEDPARNAARASDTRVDCSGMLKRDAQAAELCYAQRAAESSGLSAEAALYELARVRRDVRRDPRGALAALNEYRERFPQGSLRNEVGLSRVEILSELGRSREALTEAEALLGSAKGGERAAELYLLRGGIYRRDLSDYARAAQEYAKAEAFGGAVGAEATRLRGLSLEALGDVEGALAAYHRYLSGADQPRKSEVNRRVEALTANQRGRAP